MTNTEKWQDFVNNFIFANYTTLEIWFVKRNVAENGMILNYIQFPKAENGKHLTKGFIDFMVQSFEADDTLCKQIFGPAYEKGTAEVQDNIGDISIVWNVNYYEDVADDNEYWKELYDWKI